MSLLPIDPSQGEDFKMSSYEFLTKVINPAREEAGEKPVENSKFLARVRDELGDETKSFRIDLITPAGGGRQMESVMLDRRSLLLVGMRESKAVRRRVLDYIESQDLKLKAALKQQAELARITNRRSGTTWGDFCQLHDLQAHKLLDVILKKGRYMFVRNPVTNEWSVAPVCASISPSSRLTIDGSHLQASTSGSTLLAISTSVNRITSRSCETSMPSITTGGLSNDGRPTHT